MLGYQRKIWETVEGIKTGYSAKAHLIRGDTVTGGGRFWPGTKSPHPSAATNKTKCSCSNQNPEEETENPVQGKMGEMRFIMGRETPGVPYFSRLQ